MSDALERVLAAAATRTAAAAAPPVPPAPPAPAPTDSAGNDVSSQISDLQQGMADLNDRLTVLEQAAVDDVMSDVDGMAMDEPPALAAMPTVSAGAE